MAVNRTGSDNDRGSQFFVAETSRSPGVGGVSLGQRTSMPADCQHFEPRDISGVLTVSFTRMNDFGGIM